LIYDIVIFAVFLGMLLSGMKRGFASAVVGLAAIFVAFVCAMTFSAPISEALYSAHLEPPLEEAVESVVDDAFDKLTLAELSDLDFDEVTVNGNSLVDLTPDYSSSNLYTYDLAQVDLSATGIAEYDLSAFGLSEDIDYTAVNGKTAEFTRTDIDRYGLGRMIVAQIIAVHLADTEYIEMLESFTDKVGEAAPIFFGNMSERIRNGDSGSVRSVILIMMTSELTAKEAVIDGMIRPCYSIASETLFFCIIFLVVAIALSVVARLLKIVNKIPLIGALNVLAGGIVGAVQGLLTIFIVCLIVRVITVLSGGNVMFFNNSAIEETLFFKTFYNYEFLNFID